MELRFSNLQKKIEGNKTAVVKLAQKYKNVISLSIEPKATPIKRKWLLLARKLLLTLQDRR